MKKINNLSVKLDEDLEEKLQYLSPGFSSYRILRKSIDARKRSEVKEVYSLEVFDKDESPPENRVVLEKLSKPPKEMPIIIGTGPCGLFAALRLAERGIPCRIFERGSPAQKRVLAINKFWRYGELNEDDNVCFGEGGAGLYSDGKLITRIKSPHIPYVMERFVDFGAPEEIKYLANPHIGSDKIRRLIPKIRERLTDLGCEIYYNTKVEELLFEGSEVVGVRTSEGKKYSSPWTVLATGHSATDMFNHLKESGVYIEGKSFAMGLRIEHPQELINKIQFRDHYDHPKLGAANYKLTDHDHNTGIGVYSFCMCPGGYVLSSGTDQNSVVCNGMSNYNRGSKYANSGIVISIDHETNFGKDDFGGLKLRNQIEEYAFKSVQSAGGTKEIPAQSAIDFLEGKLGDTLPTSSPSGVKASRLDEVLTPQLRDALRNSLLSFEEKMKGFIGNSAQLHGVESRTSCPVRVKRDPETLESVSHSGLFPGGEGAGYAGGITSAAVDGIKIAEKIYKLVTTSALLFFLLFSPPTFGLETDNFNNRDIPDVTELLNESVNNRLQQISELTLACEREELIDAVKLYLNTEPASDVTLNVYNNHEMYGTRRLDIDESVFRFVSLKSSFFLSAGALCCAANVRINDSVFGTDKISHFFNHGYRYHKKYRKQTGSSSDKLDAAFSEGLFLEDGDWGLSSTGVFSYADLASNYDGMRFWNELLDGNNPYFRCIDGKYQKSREFDWKEYVSDAWDEAINCNTFSKQSLADEFRQGLQREDQPDLTCPLDARRCLALRQHYGPASYMTLNPSCENISQIREPHNSFPNMVRNAKEYIGGAIRKLWHRISSPASTSQDNQGQGN